MSQPIHPIYQRIFSLLVCSLTDPFFPYVATHSSLSIESRRHVFDGIFCRLPPVQADDAQAGFERVYKDGRAALSRAEAEAKTERLAQLPINKGPTHSPSKEADTLKTVSYTPRVPPLMSPAMLFPMFVPHVEKKTNPSRIDPTTSLSSDLVFST